jgi:hypothetical protein
MRRVAIVLCLVACREAAASAGTDSPVLVELFTSEGCSSCPPADAVLADLERTRGVVVLGHHVDYWDGLGWKDPFSSANATSRQRAYAAAIGGGTYTPEAVVDGRVQVLGSRRTAIEAAVQEAAKKPHASVAVELAPAGDAQQLTVRVGALPADATDDAELVVATVTPAAHVTIPRGENAGRTVDHVAIARGLVTVGVVPRAGSTSRVLVAKDAARLVVFVQEKGSRRVLGTAVLRRS